MIVLALAEMDGHVSMSVGQFIMKRTQGNARATWTCGIRYEMTD